MDARSPDQLPEHIAENRRHWDSLADDWVARGERCWAQAEPSWGEWQIPEARLRMLPDDPGGRDAIELGYRLERDYVSLHRVAWREAADEPGGIEFNLPISGWLRLFRERGFVVEDYIEIQSPEPGPEVHDFVTADWAHRFPSEQVWKLRKPTTA